MDPKLWTRELLCTSTDPPHPIPCSRNYLTALLNAPELVGRIQLNSFTNTIVVTDRLPWGKFEGHWADVDNAELAAWLANDHIKLRARPSDLAPMVAAAASRHSFHPVRDYLYQRIWDGESRLDTVLHTHFGARWTDYTQAVGPKWFISAVARVMEPGCKADACLVLEGQQGTYKSSAIKAIAGKEFYAELSVAQLLSKDTQMLCHRSWIIELAELATLSKATIEGAKAFLSCDTDTFRPPYGRYVLPFPRQCVFAGTTNDDEYLIDPTGGRRFWPVRCGHIHIDQIKADRDQLWAEAMHRYQVYKSHEDDMQAPLWWLDNRDTYWAEKEQLRRQQPDEWLDDVAAYLKKNKITECSVVDLLKKVINLELREIDRKAQMRMAKCLTQLGWQKHQVHGGLKRWKYETRGRRI